MKAALQKWLSVTLLSLVLPSLLAFAVLADLFGMRVSGRDLSLDIYTRLAPFAAETASRTNGLC